MKEGLRKGVLIVFIISIIFILVKIVRRMGWGIVNKNPFNIRPGDNWLGSVGQAGGFVKFAEFKWGLRAGLLNLWNGYFKFSRTIKQIFYMYAPPGDGNNTEAYINAVCKETGLNPDSVPGKKDYLNVAAAIIYHESGVKLYNEEDLRKVAVEFGFNQYL